MDFPRVSVYSFTMNCVMLIEFLSYFTLFLIVGLGLHLLFCRTYKLIHNKRKERQEAVTRGIMYSVVLTPMLMRHVADLLNERREETPEVELTDFVYPVMLTTLDSEIYTP
ncbi:unnamed protein product [Caenorhabditis auriculariae]|uniref:Uncharacterized protein n=1 Tax=Caenorhabditis auriculariae TaxID=2777116 RepID=A0A8S1HES9_9PELO|nr:unnamed protein product [Caenorhabditis auriculariae]